MVTGAENIGFRKAPQITVGAPEQFVKKVGSENWNHYFLLFKIKSGGKKNG